MSGDAGIPAEPPAATEATEHRVAEHGSVYEGQRLQLCLEVGQRWLNFNIHQPRTHIPTFAFLAGPLCHSPQGQGAVDLH